MRVLVRSKDFCCELTLFKKDYPLIDDFLIEAATAALEIYYEKSQGNWFSVPYFIKVSVNGKNYMVNCVLALANAGLHKFSESLRKEMINDDLKMMIDQKILKI
jgi:hypothetical protein